MESEQASHELTDFGEDWEKRPAPPTSREEAPAPKPEPAEAPAGEKAEKAKQLQEEATKLLLEAVPLFKDVRAAADAAGTRAEREEGLRKADQCEKRLYDAQLKFTLAEKDSADPETVKRYIKQIDGLLKTLAEYRRKLSAR
jgi:hypothetical protein